MIQPYLVILPSQERGKGVFTTTDIQEGTILEISPVLVMTETDRNLLDQSLLHDYIFEWEAEKKTCCMALGYIPMYNHSSPSNCDYIMDFEHETMSIVTVRDVQKGEELFINYNGAWNEDNDVWFDTV